jgi:hypothetical protein
MGNNLAELSVGLRLVIIGIENCGEQGCSTGRAWAVAGEQGFEVGHEAGFLGLDLSGINKQVNHDRD